MNTKQLTVLWYGVLAAVAFLLAQGEGELWPSLGAVALVTAALIYTLGPMHSARLGRVALAVSAPFILVGLGFAAVYGYRSWRQSVVADAVTVRDVRVAKKPDCPSSPDSADGPSSDEAGVTQSGILSLSDLDLTPDCHRIEGTLHNGSDAEVRSVMLEITVSDSAGQTLSETMGLGWILAGEQVEFSKSVHLPADVEGQQVDSVQVREVQIGE